MVPPTNPRTAEDPCVQRFKASLLAERGVSQNTWEGYFSDLAQFAAFVNAKQNCAAICFDGEADLIPGQKIAYGSRDDKEKLAKNLFAALRQVDTLGAERVYVHAPDKSGMGLAIYNRLLRAAGFKVIKL